MSTRAIIQIKQGQRKQYIYHQCDGYPEYVGKDVKRMLDQIGHWTLKKITRQLLDGIVHEYSHDYKEKDSNYECIDRPCGWEAYGYVIDCDAKTLRAYYFGLHNMPDAPIGDDWSQCEEIRPDERECDDTDVIEELKNRDLVNVYTNIRLKDAQVIGCAPLPASVNKVNLLFGYHNQQHLTDSFKPDKPLLAWDELLCAVRDKITSEGRLCGQWLNGNEIDDLCFIWTAVQANGVARFDIDFSHVINRCYPIPEGKRWVDRLGKDEEE